MQSMAPVPVEVPTEESLVTLFHAAAQEGSCLLYASLRLYYGIDLDDHSDPYTGVKEGVLHRLVQKGIRSGFKENGRSIKLKETIWKIEDDRFLLYYLASDEQMLIEGNRLSPESYVLAPNEYHPEVKAATTNTPADEHYGWHRVYTREAVRQEEQRKAIEDAQFKEFAGIEQKRPVMYAIIKQEKLAEVKAKLLADQERIVARQARRAERNRIRAEKAAAAAEARRIAEREAATKHGGGPEHE